MLCTPHEYFVETRVLPTGVAKPMAANLMRKKAELKSNVKILADVNVKHSAPLVEQDLNQLISEAISYACDGIIITGIATGNAPDVKDTRRFKNLMPKTDLFIGSGVNNENISSLLEYADGVIVGSSIKEDGDVKKAVDVERVKALIKASKA